MGNFLGVTKKVTLITIIFEKRSKKERVKHQSESTLDNQIHSEKLKNQQKGKPRTFLEINLENCRETQSNFML
jgi:hypothetical protein